MMPAFARQVDRRYAGPIQNRRVRARIQQQLREMPVAQRGGQVQRR